MTVCLHGGAEFGPGSRALDAELVQRAAGRVVVVPLAAAPGKEYDLAGANGVRHYRAVGAGDVLAAPDARAHPAEAAAAVRGGRLVVLPGGSPSRLLAALRSTPVAEALRAGLTDGALLVGASAGAMVLGSWTVLPDRRGAGHPAVEPGLGVAGDLAVVPHWSGGSSRRDWLRALERALPSTTTLLGLPEESGVLVEDGVLTAMGRRPTVLIDAHVELPPGRTWTLA